MMMMIAYFLLIVRFIFFCCMSWTFHFVYKYLIFIMYGHTRYIINDFNLKLISCISSFLHWCIINVVSFLVWFLLFFFPFLFLFVWNFGFVLMLARHYFKVLILLFMYSSNTWESMQDFWGITCKLTTMLQFCVV